MKHYLVDRYQVCLNYATLGQKGLPQGSHVLHRFILEKHEKIFLFETTRPNLDIWYIASSSGPLPSLFKLCPWGQKIGIGLYRDGVNRSKSTFSEQGNHEFSNMVANTPGAKNGPVPGVTCFTCNRLIWENMKKNLPV